MFDNLTSVALTLLHDEKLDGGAATNVYRLNPADGIWQAIEENHRCNTLLWEEEDRARRTDVPAREIARSKRLIDGYNQKRNDAVERIDEHLLHALRDVEPVEGARLNSETAGAMIDRLSILSLKIHHMRVQTQRSDADEAHLAACTEKLHRLVKQRVDLSYCFDQFLREARAGKAYFKMYRQFKMYNDPTLNPYLYATSTRSGVQAER